MASVISAYRTKPDTGSSTKIYARPDVNNVISRVCRRSRSSRTRACPRVSSRRGGEKEWKRRIVLFPRVRTGEVVASHSQRADKDKEVGRADCRLYAGPSHDAP